MPEPRSQRMARVDTAWLRMDNDVNLMMIVGVWLLTPAITLDALRERIETRLLKYERFRHKAVADAMGAMWVEDTDFDIDRQVVLEQLPKKRGQTERQALQQRCGELAVTPLDPDRPLWQFHLVERYEGGSAIIARIHHCIGDGIALISVMNSITDGGNDPPKRRRKTVDDDGDHDWLSDAVLKPLTGLAVKALDMYGSGVARSIEALSHPREPLQGSLDMAKAGLQVASDLAALALMADDSPTRLKGQPEGRKLAVWCQPLPLAEVKAVGKALACSVNDVLLSCAAGAIGSYLRAHGDIHDGMTLLVRQLPPGPTGLPLEIYCFTRTVAWGPYEGIQSDIFDHLLAILPEFGLRVFQEPAGADFRALAAGEGVRSETDRAT